MLFQRPRGDERVELYRLDNCAVNDALRFQELRPLLQDEAVTTTFNAAAAADDDDDDAKTERNSTQLADASRTATSVAALPPSPSARQIPDPLNRKLSSHSSPIDRRRLLVTSSSPDRGRPPRFWSPLCQRRHDDSRASASMHDFRDFRFQQASPSTSSAEVGDAESLAESVVVAERRHCTRQLCYEYTRRFVAFLFSTVGSCCLMVGYVILGGIIFRRLEAGHGQVVDVDMQQVKDEHVRWTRLALDPSCGRGSG